MATVRIALANLRIAATPDESVQLATAAIAEAARLGAAVVCFPECYVPGYRWAGVPAPAPDPAFLERAWAAVAAAAGAAGIAVVLGTERRHRARSAHHRAGRQRRRLGGRLAGQGADRSIGGGDLRRRGHERRVFTAGPLTFGVAICHEGWRYPETVRWAARRGAQVVFHPHAHVAEPGSYRPAVFADPANTFHEKAMFCRAAENTIYFASVNAASEGSGTTSAVIRPDGTVQAWQPYGQSGLLVADLDLSLATGRLASRCRTVP